MIINCPKCKKKFEVNQNLIPSNGRLLQCGSCQYKWHFKINSKESIKKSNLEISKKQFQNTSDDISHPVLPKKNINETKISKNKINLSKAFIVFIISLIALLLMVDTFKHQISIFIPSIEKILNNLYETIVDIKLFIKDLI